MSVCNNTKYYYILKYYVVCNMLIFYEIKNMLESSELACVISLYCISAGFHCLGMKRGWKRGKLKIDFFRKNPRPLKNSICDMAEKSGDFKVFMSLE